MARARNIKPGFFSNEDLAECSPWARLCFIGLWTLADREGRLEDRPKRIKGELFRFDSVEVEPLLQELARFKFIIRYEIDGNNYIQIPGFATHQTPHYSEKPSSIKPQQISDDSRITPGKTVDDDGRPPGEHQKNSRITPRISASSRGGCNLLNPDSLNPDSKPRIISIPVTTGDAPPCEEMIFSEKQKNPKNGHQSHSPSIQAPEAEVERPPENPTADALQVETEPPPGQGPTKAGLLAAWLRRMQIDTTSTRAEVIDWARENVSQTIIAEAVDIARTAKPNERISSAYLAPIVRQLLQPKKPKEDPWWTTEKATEAKAREVGCWPAQGGETWDQLRKRINEKISEQRRVTT